MFQFSEYGIKNIEAYKIAYSDFIEWCRARAKQGTFSTYMDGEPVFLTLGTEVSYSHYKKLN